ncbi:hypothetical protein E4T47_04698, partial [Aureobasidium subglaciale]
PPAFFTDVLSVVRYHPRFAAQDCDFHAELWWELSQLDPAVSSQVDSMLATKYGFLMTKPNVPFDLDGPTPVILRLQALRAIQRAIEDPRRCYSVGTIAAITASIFEAVSDMINSWTHARENDVQVILHLRGLRTIITHRPGGLASLRSYPKLWILIAMCEVICATTWNTIPELPFPMDYFQEPVFLPTRPPSEFSELVDTAWVCKQQQSDVTTRTYDHMSHYPRPLNDEQQKPISLHPRTMMTIFNGFKMWLSLPCAHLLEDQEMRMTLLRSVDSLLDTPTLVRKQWSSRSSELANLPWSGQDVLKLIILVVRCGNEMHPILNTLAAEQQ